MSLIDDKEVVLNCDGCGVPMQVELTQMPMWFGAELKLISSVPAHVCETCDRQQFSPRVDAALGELVALGFPDRLMRHQMLVSVFDLDDFVRSELGVAAE